MLKGFLHPRHGRHSIFFRESIDKSGGGFPNSSGGVPLSIPPGPVFAGLQDELRTCEGRLENGNRDVVRFNVYAMQAVSLESLNRPFDPAVFQGGAYDVRSIALGLLLVGRLPV